jgi:hypothetical protein
MGQDTVPASLVGAVADPTVLLFFFVRDGARPYGSLWFGTVPASTNPFL